MEAFLSNIFGFPTVIFTCLMIIICVYWLFAIVGLLDLDILNLGVADTDVNMDVDAGSLEGLAGLMVTLGLTGVPVTVVLTILVLIAWSLSFLAVHFFFFWELSGWWNTLIGMGVAIGAFAVSIPATATLIKPLKPLFRKAYSTPLDKMLIGQTCTVRSTQVDANFGEATATVNGASLILKVRNESGNAIARGDKVVLMEYQKETNTYLVIPEKVFNSAN